MSFVSAPLVAAIVLLAGVYCLPHHPAWFVIVSCAAAVVITVFAGTVLMFEGRIAEAEPDRRGYRRRLERIRTVAIGAALGLVLLAHFGRTGLESSCRVCCTEQTLETVRGVVTDDARLPVKRVALSIREIGTKNGTRIEAPGRALFGAVCYVDSKRALYRGTIVEIAGIRFVRYNHEKSGSTAILQAESIEALGWSSGAWRIRAGVIDDISRITSRFGVESGAMFRALFLGIRDDTLKDSFYFVRRAGCIHLFALSGLHVGILVAGFIVVLRPVAGRALARKLAVPAVWGYVFLIGAGPALVRAAAMYSCAVLLSASGRRGRTVDVVAASLLLCAAVAPLSMHTVSFQLTFLAVTGIVVPSRPLQILLSRYLPVPVASALAVSLGAFISTLWLLAATFGRAYPVGIVASIVLTPIITLYLAAGLGTLFLDAIGMSGSWLGARALDIAYSGMNGIFEWFGKITGYLSRFPSITIESAYMPYVLAAGAIVFYIVVLRNDQF